MSVQWNLEDEPKKNKLNRTSIRKGTTSEITGLGSDDITPGDVIVNTSKNILLLNIGTSSNPRWVSDLLPLGTIRVWPGKKDDIPSGWVLCDGSSYSKTTYPDVYSIIGDNVITTTSQFYVPDFRLSRFVMGANLNSEVGDQDGETEHTLTIGEMPEHTHSATRAGRQLLGGDTDTVIDKSTSSTGGGEAHNNLPPYIKLHYIIKLELH